MFLIHDLAVLLWQETSDPEKSFVIAFLIEEGSFIKDTSLTLFIYCTFMINKHIYNETISFSHIIGGRHKIVGEMGGQTVDF